MTETQTKTLGVTIQEISESMDVDFRDDYSGRGMYGETCVGVVGSPSELMDVIIEVIKVLANDMVNAIEHNPYAPLDDFEKAVDKLFSYRTGHMGMDMIFYWPDIN